MERKNSRLGGLGWILLAAVVVAYRAVAFEAVRAIAGRDLASLLFVPGEDTILIGLAVACLLVFRRRATFAELFANGPQSHVAVTQPGWAIPGLGLALVALGWSAFVGRPELSLLSLAIGLTSTAAICSGAAGAQTMFLPALVLVFTVPLPAPVESEWVWALQKATASVTAACLDVLGFDSTLEGIRITRNRLAFEVTESCSGLRLVQILLPLAIAIGDAAGLREGRLFSFAIFGTFLALVINTGRLVFEAARLGPAGPASASNLGLQGLLLVALALATLAFVARALRRPANAAEIEARVDRKAAPSKSEELLAMPRNLSRRLIVATVGLAMIASTASFFAPGGQADLINRTLPTPSLAPTSNGWISHEIPPNYAFPYSTSNHRRVARRYAPAERMPGVPPGSVEIFVAYEARDMGGPDRIPRTKLPIPDADWKIAQHTPPRKDLLAGRTIAVTELSRNEASEHALTYSWRVRDRGFARESLRSLLGLNPEPDGAARPRAVVRLATSIAAGLRSDRRRATTLLDQFVRDFEKELDAL